MNAKLLALALSTAAFPGCGGSTIVGPVDPPAPDARVAYAALDAERTSVALYVADLAGGAPPETLLTAAGLARAQFPLVGGTFGAVAWAPDGRTVAFDVIANEGAAVGVLTADGRVRAVGGASGPSARPRWSPSGRELLVDQSRFLGEPTGTFAVAADGTGVAECVLCADRPFILDAAGAPVAIVGAVEWGRTDDEVAVAVADPADVRASPDRHPTHVYLVGRRSLRPTLKLTEDPVEGTGFALAPGGGAAAFTRGRGADRTLYAARPVGATPVLIARGADVGRYGWGRDGLLWYVVGDGGSAVLRIALAEGGGSLDVTRRVGAVYGADSAAGPAG